MADMYTFYLLHLICFCIVLVSCELIGENVCLDSSGKEYCCSNYIEVNRTCIECPPGTVGTNCIKCPTSYYGRSCSLKCNCSINETCDNVHGCICEPPACLKGEDIQTTISVILIGKKEDDDVMLLKILTFTISGLVIISCVIAASVSCHRRHKRKRQIKNLASISTPKQTTAAESEYQDIRESKMLTDCKTLRVEIPEGTYGKLNTKSNNNQSSDDSAFQYDTMQGLNEYSFLSFKKPDDVTSTTDKYGEDKLNDASNFSCIGLDEREYVKVSLHAVPKPHIAYSCEPVSSSKDPNKFVVKNITGARGVTVAEVHTMGDGHDSACGGRKDYKHPYKEGGGSVGSDNYETLNEKIDSLTLKDKTYEKSNHKISDGVYSLAQGVKRKK